VTDTAAASEPIGVATGDFLFVGDVGRPDLLEKAAHVAGTIESSARTLYRSLTGFATRPDWLQIWPGHGAGSSCGKGISAIPQSTLGYERRFNWAFRCRTEDEFVQAVLRGQPDPPKYFAQMKRLNKEGPRILGGFTRPPAVGLVEVREALEGGALVIDLRKALAFAVGHIPGTVNIPQNASFTSYAGWLIPYDRDCWLIGDVADVDTAVRDLALIGLDRIAGYAEPALIDAWASAAHRNLGTVPQIGAVDLAESLRHHGATLVDVRNDSEWTTNHIDGARHIPLGHLVDRLTEVPRTKPVVVQCLSGGRSSIGASLLKAHGFEHVSNLAGGISDWIKQGLPVVTEDR